MEICSGYRNLCEIILAPCSTKAVDTGHRKPETYHMHVKVRHFKVKSKMCMARIAIECHINAENVKEILHINSWEEALDLKRPAKVTLISIRQT